MREVTSQLTRVFSEAPRARERPRWQSRRRCIGAHSFMSLKDVQERLRILVIRGDRMFVRKAMQVTE
jgi:hypothetical protein